MINAEKWERKTYELTCISPIHVGNGEVLKQYEYIWLCHNKWLVFDEK